MPKTSSGHSHPVDHLCLQPPRGCVLLQTRLLHATGHAPCHPCTRLWYRGKCRTATPRSAACRRTHRPAPTTSLMEGVDSCAQQRMCERGGYTSPTHVGLRRRPAAEQRQPLSPSPQPVSPRAPRRSSIPAAARVLPEDEGSGPPEQHRVGVPAVCGPHVPAVEEDLPRVLRPHELLRGAPADVRQLNALPRGLRDEVDPRLPRRPLLPCALLQQVNLVLHTHTHEGHTRTYTQGGRQD